MIALAGDRSDPIGETPLPLTMDEILACGGDRLALEHLEDHLDAETPPVRRYRATWRRARRNATTAPTSPPKAR